MNTLVVETDLTITRDGQVIADVTPRNNKYRLWITSPLLRTERSLEEEIDELQAEIREYEMHDFECDHCEDARTIIRSDKTDAEKIDALRELLAMEAA